MIAPFKVLLVPIGLAFTAPACAVVQAPPASESISALDLAEDIDSWVEWTLATHPNLSWSAPVEALRAEAAALQASLAGPYDTRRAWLALAVLNPTLNDAHAGVRYPEAAFEAYQAGGGAIFPTPIEARPDGLFVADTIADGSALRAGDAILAINQRPADDILGALLPRMRGETPTLRARVLSLRFAGALWALTGGADTYSVEVDRHGRGVEHVVLDPARDGAGTPRSPFTLSWRADIAVLDITSFDRVLEAEFTSFLDDAFAQIGARNTTTVVIDLRKNGGGARQLSDQLAAYLTAGRYTPISAVQARIIPQNQALVPGSSVGEVIATPFAQWVEPPETLAGRHGGDTVIMIGPNTYSQAVVFAATAQDFGFARLAGQPTEGPANQTGQVQSHTLPHSGLTVLSPIYIFTRASGTAGRAPLQPDIQLTGDNPAQLEALLAGLAE